MIQQVIVVEGKSDIARVRQAVDADLIATGGYALRLLYRIFVPLMKKEGLLY